MAKKLKLDTSTLTEADIQIKVGELADVIRLKKAEEAKRDALLEKMNAKIHAIRAAHADELTLIDNAIKAYSQQYDAEHALIQAWAEAKKPVLFAVKRSIEFLRGTIGFNRTPHAVGTLKGWTQPKAALALLAKKWGKEYVNITYSLNKSRILLDRDVKGFAKKLETVGITIGQDDEFYFKPKTEKSETPTPEAA